VYLQISNASGTTNPQILKDDDNAKLGDGSINKWVAHLLPVTAVIDNDIR
jgi:hypothetical protein